MTQKTDKTNRNVIAHELFYSLQDILGCRDMAADGSAIEFDRSPDEWETVVFPLADSCTQYQSTAKELWNKFRLGQINPLCAYQTKNIDEMFAVAFEAYHENPTVLKTEQPEVYSYIESTLSASASSSSLA